MTDIIGRALALFVALGMVWMLSLMGFFEDPIGTITGQDFSDANESASGLEPFLIIGLVLIMIKMFWTALVPKKHGGG